MFNFGALFVFNYIHDFKIVFSFLVDIFKSDELSLIHLNKYLDLDLLRIKRRRF